MSTQEQQMQNLNIKLADMKRTLITKYRTKIIGSMLEFDNDSIDMLTFFKYLMYDIFNKLQSDNSIQFQDIIKHFYVNLRALEKLFENNMGRTVEDTFNGDNYENARLQAQAEIDQRLQAALARYSGTGGGRKNRRTRKTRKSRRRN